MRDISLLHPLVQKKLRKFIDLAEANSVEFLVHSTFRGKVEQNNLEAQGRTLPGPIVTNAKYPYSFHNHGVAFDIVPLKDGQPDWNDHEKFNKLGELGKSVGLEWGGDWQFADKPHFQYTQGRTIYDFVGGYTLEIEMTDSEKKYLKENEAILAQRTAKAWEYIDTEVNAAKKSVAQIKGVPFTPYIIVDGKDL